MSGNQNVGETKTRSFFQLERALLQSSVVTRHCKEYKVISTIPVFDS